MQLASSVSFNKYNRTCIEAVEQHRTTILPYLKAFYGDFYMKEHTYQAWLKVGGESHE